MADDKKTASLEDEHLDDAFDALVGRDKSAFREAIKNAVEACVERAQADDYSQDKTTDEKE